MGDISQWNRDEQLARLQERPLSKQDMVIAQMWIYQRDLEIQGNLYAGWKATHDKRKAIHVMKKRYEAGEKSGEMCQIYADSQDDVFEADLAYRQAEQMVAADKSMLQILHAELEKWRTEQANERAADDLHRRTGV